MPHAIVPQLDLGGKSRGRTAPTKGGKGAAATGTSGFSPVPDKNELALYEEEVVQREQMMGPGGEKKETLNNGESESDAATLIFSAETDKLQVHKTWLVMARVCVENGDIGSCRLLLAEAERHSVAFDDAHAMADIQELRCLVALAEGDVPRAKERLEQCMKEKRAIVDVSIATRRVLLLARVLTDAGDAHSAKKIITSYLTSLQKRTKAATTRSTERGGRKNASVCSELDLTLATVDAKTFLARAACTEVVGLRSRDSPWMDEWKKCERIWQESVECLESLSDRGVRLPLILEEWSLGIERVVAATGSGSGGSGSGNNKGEGEDLLEGSNDKVLELLERAELHASVRDGLTRPTARAGKKGVLEMFTPCRRIVALLQLSIGDRHLSFGRQRYQKEEERRRTMRRQERSLGMGSNGGGSGDDNGSDDVVSQWLERTAAPPPLSSDDCQVQATEYALFKFTAAHSSSSRAPSSLRCLTSSRVGVALLQLSREREQCLGVWPREESLDAEEEKIYADSLRRVHGQGHLRQAKRVLLESIELGLSSQNFHAVGVAAKGLADCYGSYSPRESAKYVSLWQSCMARDGMMTMYNDACRPTAPETSFVRRVTQSSQRNEKERT